jgi:thiol-disulfide isomerase/thioredoxin
MTTFIRRLGIVGCLLLFGVGGAAAQSQEIPLGTTMPMADQALPQASGSQASLSGLAGSAGTVVLFWSNQCPWTDKYEGRMEALYDEYNPQGISFVLVNSNDASAFPQESAQSSAEQGHPMPYLMDKSSALANAFGASRAPHVFVFDADQSLVYVGTIDDSPGDPGNVQNTYLADALAALVGGEAIPVAKTKAFGCTIKYASN